MISLESAEFAYGNTRLRARRAKRLSSAALLDLAARDIEGLYGALSVTVYRVQVEAALARGGGAARLHEAIRAQQAAELMQLRGFYEGRALELIDLLLTGYDLSNLLALLRATLRGADVATDATGDVVPIGAFSTAVVREIGRRHEPAALIELLVAWELPDRETSRAVVDAYGRYERDADLAGFEHAVAAHHAARVAAHLDRLGADARPLRAVLARRIDERNLMTGLRLRAAIEEDPTSRQSVPWLPGGTASAATLDAALSRPSIADVAAALTRAIAGDVAGSVLATFAFDGDLVAAERTLDNCRVLDELVLYHRDDPLGIAIPIATCAELELETRNLRVLVEGAALDLEPGQLRGRLLLHS